jgi:histidinol-phosphate phosphatase family protein
MSARAVFLDRDGVLMEDANYVGHVERVKLIPGAVEAVRRLLAAGFKIFVVTNQSGVGRGYFTREAVEEIHHHLRQQGIQPDRFYVCPHHPEDNCDCRKPKPKFLLEAAREYDLDLAASYMIGDRSSDLLAGLHAGAQPILVLTGVGRETLAKNDVRPVHVAADVAAAADWILAGGCGTMTAK